MKTSDEEFRRKAMKLWEDAGSQTPPPGLKGAAYIAWALSPEHHEREGVNPRTGKKDVYVCGRDGNGVGYGYWRGDS